MERSETERNLNPVTGQETAPTDDVASHHDANPMDDERSIWKSDLFFDVKKASEGITHEYVCWLDIMGTRQTLLRSTAMAANFIGKLHAAVLRTTRQLSGEGNDQESLPVLYPMLDGVYVTCKDDRTLTRFLTCVYAKLATEFLSQKQEHYRFIPKASVAYGPVLHARNLEDKACYDLTNDKQYRNSLFFGIPISQAQEGERKAPPFGVYIHESARAFGSAKQQFFKSKWWHWFSKNPNDRNCPPRLATDLESELEAHYAWCKEESIYIGYPESRIEEHERYMRQYFSVWKEILRDARLRSRPSVPQ